MTDREYTEAERKALADREAKLRELGQYAEADRRRKYSDRYQPGPTPRQFRP